MLKINKCNKLSVKIHEGTNIKGFVERVETFFLPSIYKWSDFVTLVMQSEIKKDRS